MEEAEQQQLLEELKNLDAQIELTEQRRDTATPEFVALLKRKLEICTALNKQKDVTNCEARIRFIEARMRGESLPHTDIIDFQRVKRRQSRNHTNTMLLMLVMMFVICAASLPMLKKVVDTRIAAREMSGDYEDTIGRRKASETAHSSATPESVGTTSGGGGEVRDISDRGHALVMSEYLRSGRKNIFFFHSNYCGPCEAAIPMYNEVARLYPEHRFYIIDIDRPGSPGIDWDSPVAQQFGLHSIPYFVIYDGLNEVASGKEAREQLNEMAGNR